MSDVNSRVAVLEGWKETHENEHEAIWDKVNTTHDRALMTETKLMIYTSIGAAVGGVAGSVIGGVIVFIMTKGHP